LPLISNMKRWCGYGGGGFISINQRVRILSGPKSFTCATLIKIFVVNYTITRRWYSQCKNREKHELCRWASLWKSLMSTFPKILHRWFYVVFYVEIVWRCSELPSSSMLCKMIKYGNNADDIYVYPRIRKNDCALRRSVIFLCLLLHLHVRVCVHSVCIRHEQLWSAMT